MSVQRTEAVFTQAVTLLQFSDVKSVLQIVRDALKWSLRGDLKPSLCPGPLFDLRGFSTLHTKFYDKGSALKNFFNAQTSSIT